jgi:ribosome maturation factor RimP
VLLARGVSHGAVFLTAPSSPGHLHLPSMSEPDRSLPASLDRTRLDAVVEPIVRAHGAEVVDVEFKGGILRVFVEKAGASAARLSTEDAAVDLELCANVARDLSPALDVADLIPHRYSLEVSSPGVERPLRTAHDYARFAGQKAKLKLAVPVDGQRALRGELGPVEEGEGGPFVTLAEGRKAYRIPLADITSAHLVFEFGPAPKPGKGPRPKGPRSEGSPPKGPRSGGPPSDPQTGGPR